MLVFGSLSEAYLALLKLVYETPEYTLTTDHIDGAGQGALFNTTANWECTNVQFRIQHVTLQDDCPRTLSPSRNQVMRDYIAAETPLFDAGDTNATGNFSRLSKVWDTIKNPDGTINANYGLMVYHDRDAGQGTLSQWEWARALLQRYKETRQGVMLFYRPRHQWAGNRDQPCTVFVQFLIRDHRLHFSSYMRSNDLVLGTPYNLSYFIKLMHRMCDELQDTYPGLTVGHLTHTVTSLHIYQRSEPKVRAMLYGEEPHKGQHANN